LPWHRWPFPGQHSVHCRAPRDHPRRTAESLPVRHAAGQHNDHEPPDERPGRRADRRAGQALFTDSPVSTRFRGTLAMSQPNFSRRRWLATVGKVSAAGAALTMAPAFATGKAGKVVVVGGGFGGATAAKYIKRRNPAIDVVLIEPAKTYYTCPFTNLYF